VQLPAFGRRSPGHRPALRHMLAPTTTTDFLAVLRKSGLVDESRLTELFPDADNLPPDPRACATGLVKGGVLTQYQAKMLVNGKSRGFFVGPYVIQGPIGQGGMGVVYLARHTSLDRHVALKILASGPAKDQLTLNRFLREARASAALDHPNIVRLYDIGQSADMHYLVMEYVDGTNVQAMLERSGPLPYGQAADYVAQAAAGLQHAHSRGIVHRDVKPGNLMLTEGGTIKILDMGLARSVRDQKDHLTELHGQEDITGTADFVSPEHLRGEKVDERGDIYSLGVTLFSLLVGRPPFMGTTAQKLAAHEFKDPADLRTDLSSRAPPGLADVVVKMMAKRKEDRYQSAQEVIAALAPWNSAGPSGNASKDPVRTRNLRAARMSSSVAPPQYPIPTGRKKWLLIGGAIGTVLLIGGLSLALGSGGKNTASAQDPALPGPGPMPQPAPNAVPGPVEPPRALRAHAAGINDLVFGNDGLVAAVDWSGHLVYWNVNTGQPARSTPVRPGSKLNTCAATKDGQFLVVGGDKTPVLVLDWATGHVVHEYPGHGNTTWGVAVSPSGRDLLTCGTDGVVMHRDLATGQEIRRFQFEATLVWAVAFSPDGAKMAASCGIGPSEDESYQIRVWETATGKELHRLTGHTRDVRWLSFHPDGWSLASAGFDGTVRLWDLTVGKQIRSIPAHSGFAERVFFVHGGKNLVSCGGPLANSANPGEGGALKVWDATTGDEIRAWRGDAAVGIISLAVSRDGTAAVTGSRDKIVRIWRLN